MEPRRNSAAANMRTCWLSTLRQSRHVVASQWATKRCRSRAIVRVGVRATGGARPRDAPENAAARRALNHPSAAPAWRLQGGRRDFMPRRLADEVADARQELGAHGRMEALRVGAADREHAGRPPCCSACCRAARARPSRSRSCRRRTGNRAGCRGSGRSAAGRTRTASRTSSARPPPHRRFADDGCSSFDNGDSPSAASSSIHSDAPKSSRSDASSASISAARVLGAHQAAGETMNLRGEHVVAARHFDQLAQAGFELLVLVAQRRNLALDQRDRRSCRGCEAA